MGAWRRLQGRQEARAVGQRLRGARRRSRGVDARAPGHTMTLTRVLRIGRVLGSTTRHVLLSPAMEKFSAYRVCACITQINTTCSCIGYRIQELASRLV